MESKLTFRAGRQVAIGYDGGEIKVFEPDEEIPGAAELPTFPGLLLNRYIRAFDEAGSDVSEELWTELTSEGVA